MIDISRFEKIKKLGISFSIDAGLNEFLESYSKEIGINKSKIIQYLVKDLYERVKAEKEGKKTGEVEAEKWLNKKTQGEDHE